ncbi:MAG: phospho-N-acetylmuramoyl-pentapeptide-transferase [Bacteroidales bacterium]
MLYWLYEILKDSDIPGIGMLQYLSFRSSVAIVLSLIIATIFGKTLIRFLQKRQIGEEIRDLDLAGQLEKKGTPTMGGIIIILAIIVPTILCADLSNVYVILMLIATVWLGFIGFVDDYIKVFKKNKKGLAGKFKIVAQVLLGIGVTLALYNSEKLGICETNIEPNNAVNLDAGRVESAQNKLSEVYYHTTRTTIPFSKKIRFHYGKLVGADANSDMAWIAYGLIIVFVIVAVSNAVNLTDGLDGLAAGTTAISGSTLGILAYLSGNVIFASYLNIMYLPDIGELTVFSCAFIGALIGFLWYNSYPAQVFMGDTGSLTLGGILAVLAILIRKELLIPVLCFVFLAENLSVVIQVFWFKFTKRMYGEGRRVFRMSPIHHHFQKCNYAEPKIVSRFWIVAIAFAAITIVILKIR